MRSVVVGAALAVLLAGGASAQSVELGLKGGYSHSTLSGDITGVKGMNRPGGGAFLTWRLHPRFALQPELLYQQTGGSGTVGAGVSHYRREQLQLPILFKALRGITPSVEANLYAGPAYGVRVGCDYTREPASGTGFEQSCAGSKDYVAPQEWSAVMGGGVSAALAGRARLVLDARYGVGFQTIDHSNLQRDVRSRVFSGMVGLSYPLGSARSGMALHR